MEEIVASDFITTVANWKGTNTAWNILMIKQIKSDVLGEGVGLFWRHPFYILCDRVDLYVALERQAVTVV